jgi:hypothetical protein
MKKKLLIILMATGLILMVSANTYQDGTESAYVPGGGGIGGNSIMLDV